MRPKKAGVFHQPPVGAHEMRPKEMCPKKRADFICPYKSNIESPIEGASVRKREKDGDSRSVETNVAPKKDANCVSPRCLQNFSWQGVGVTQLDVGVAAKPPARAVLTPYKGCFRADYRPPLHKMTSTA